MATIKYPYSVIYNGILYPADTDIEVKEEKAETPEEETAAKPKAKKAVKNDNA